MKTVNWDVPFDPSYFKKHRETGVLCYSVEDLETLFDHYNTALGSGGPIELNRWERWLNKYLDGVVIYITCDGVVSYSSKQWYEARGVSEEYIFVCSMSSQPAISVEVGDLL